VNISLTDELLKEVNDEAKKQGTNRSALIQAALEQFIEFKRREREEEEKRKKMHEASRQTDALAKKLGDWDPQPTIRKFRDTTLTTGDSPIGPDTFDGHHQYSLRQLPRAPQDWL